MAHLPCFGTYAGAAIGFALNLRRMDRVHRGQHLLLAQEFVEILLGLGVKARVVTDLKIFYLLLLPAVALVARIAVIVAKIVVVGGNRPEDAIPHDLVRGVRIIRVDKWEWLSRYVTDQAAAIVG